MLPQLEGAEFGLPGTAACASIYRSHYELHGHLQITLYALLEIHGLNILPEIGRNVCCAIPGE